MEFKQHSQGNHHEEAARLHPDRTDDRRRDHRHPGRHRAAAYRDYTIKAKITNAIGSVAGEKIKVGENYADGLALCSGVLGTICSGSGVLAGSFQTATITLTPILPTNPGGRIVWDCTGSYAAAAATANQIPAACESGKASE